MPDKSKRLDDLISTDPNHQYSDEELDVIESIDPAMALRLARVQHFAQEASQEGDPNAPVDPAAVAEAVEEARRILAQDGGDIELVGVQGRTVSVRLKGACVGCPSATLDLRNIVERLIKRRSPGVREVQNTF